MAQVEFEGRRYSLQPNETLLEALLRQGVALDYGCKAGVCHSCLLQATEGDMPQQARQGLTASQQQLGYFLPCCCQPALGASLKVQRPQGEQPLVTAQVLSVDWLNPSTVRLRLRCPLPYQPGQYLRLYRSPSVARCYSLASVPALEDYLELHIKHWPEGAVSPWLCHGLQPGDRLQLQGPLGQCFYTPQAQPMLLAGLGTGLAPLYGIVRQALQQGHSAPIYCYFGAKQAAQCYLTHELNTLAAAHPQLQVVFLAQQGQADAVQIEDIYTAVGLRHPQLKGYKVFICGADSFVRKLKKQCFLAGAAMADIATDAFMPS